MTASGIDAPVKDIDGKTLLEGPTFVAQLYAGPSKDSLAATGPISPFRQGRGAGYFVGSSMFIPSVRGGELAYVQIRVWEAPIGATYEEAVARGSKYGLSEILGLITGNAGAPPSLPTDMVGLQPFGLTVETQTIIAPPGFSLIGNPLFRGDNTVVEVLPSVPEGTILYRFDNVKKIYSVNVFDFGRWTNPDDKFQPGDGAFLLNPTDLPVNIQFIGKSVPGDPLQTPEPGFYLLTCTSVVQSCRVEQFIAFPPVEGDTVYRFNNGLYQLSVYQFGTWQGFAPVMNPGEGVFLRLVPRTGR